MHAQFFFQNSTRFFLTFHIRSNSAYIKFQNSRSLSNSIQSTYRTNQIKYYDDPVRQEDYDGHIYIYKLTERTVVLLNAIFEDVLPQTEILLPPWVKPE